MQSILSNLFSTAPFLHRRKTMGKIPTYPRKFLPIFSPLTSAKVHDIERALVLSVYVESWILATEEKDTIIL